MTKEEIRHSRGQLTQQEFAKRIGYSISVVQSWEQGKCKASKRAQEAIESAIKELSK